MAKPIIEMSDFVGQLNGGQLKELFELVDTQFEDEDVKAALASSFESELLYQAYEEAEAAERNGDDDDDDDGGDDSQ